MKKLIAFILAFAMLFTLSGFAELTDIAAHWAKDTITAWHSSGKISGYTDGTFRPDRTVTTAEFIKLLSGAIGEPMVEQTTLPYKDCTENDWFYHHVQKLYAFDILPKGDTLSPSVQITREDAATMIGKAYSLKSDKALSFTDSGEISDECVTYLAALVENGYMKGYTDNTVRPQGKLTRAEAITLLDRVSALEPTWKATQSDIFYVDAEKGDNKNDGKTPQTPFADFSAVNTRMLSNEKHLTFLFKRSQTYTGKLYVYGNVTIGAYGEGESPVFAGNQDSVINVAGGNVTISGVTVTNQDGTYGIRIVPRMSGECKNININNCFFKDIAYEVRKSHSNYDGGGIYMECHNNNPTWLDGVTIENNKFNRVARCGVFITTDWACRDPEQGWGNKNNYVDESSDWYPSKNIVVRNNYFTEMGGDVILLIGTKGALVEHNTALHIRLMTDSTAPIAGMWVHSSDDAIFRYNEVGFMKLNPGAGDGEAFDADISCRNCIFEYNYSHDNEGGFMLLCATSLGATERTIVRHNLSVNDGIDGRSTIVVSCNVRDTEFYGNTIVIRRDTRLMDIVDYPRNGYVPTNTYFRNNIFVVQGDWTSWSLFRTHNGGYEYENVVFDTNVIHNMYYPSDYGDVTEINTIDVAPKFVNGDFVGNGLYDAFSAFVLAEPIDTSSEQFGIKMPW